MAIPPSNSFLHAFRPDRTVYSICRRCQMTVASKSNEEELVEPEKTHVCSEMNLHRLFYSAKMNGTKE